MVLLCIYLRPKPSIWFCWSKRTMVNLQELEMFLYRVMCMIMFLITGESYIKIDRIWTLLKVTENLKIKKGRKCKKFYASGQKTDDSKDNQFLVLFTVLKCPLCNKKLQLILSYALWEYFLIKLNLKKEKTEWKKFSKQHSIQLCILLI